MASKDDVAFLNLWDLYSPLLTEKQQEITDLYFNYDLSLAEIAEQKGVSRQSVSDCLRKSRKQLEEYEEKLCFSKAIKNLSLEYSAYVTAVNGWRQRVIERNPQFAEELGGLEIALRDVQRTFHAEVTEVDGGKIVGTTFRENEE